MDGDSSVIVIWYCYSSFVNFYGGDVVHILPWIFFPFSRVLVFFMHDVDFYYIDGLQNILLSGPDIVAAFI